MFLNELGERLNTMPSGAMKRPKHEIINFHPKSQLVLTTA